MTQRIKSNILITFFLIGFFASFGQQEPTEIQNKDFEVFKEYKKLGLYLSPRFYNKAKVNRTSGEIDFKQSSDLGYGFGLDYLIRPAHEWSFRTGLHVNSILFSKYYFLIEAEDLGSEFPVDAINKSELSFLILSIPLEAEYKKMLKDNLFLSLKTGFDFMLLGEGSYGSSYSFLNPDNQNVSFFELIAYSPKRKIYPNLKLSPGVYFMFNTFMLQTSVVYHKNIPSVLKGEYTFFNLQVSEPSGGTYEMTGDYIGLDIVLFLKKSRKNKK